MFKILLIGVLTLAYLGQIEADNLISGYYKYYGNTCIKRNVLPTNKPSYEKEFEVINEYLEINSISGIEEFISTLAWLRTSKSNSYARDQALNLLIGLINLEGDNLCNQRSIEILVQSEKATKCSARKPASQSPILSRFVRHYLLQHEKDCRDIYTKRFASLYEPLSNEEPMKLVEALTKGYIYGGILYMNGSETNQWRACNSSSDLTKSDFESLLPMTIKDLFNSVQLFSARDINLALKHFTSEQPEEAKLLQRPVANQERIEQLLDKYILSPCQYYANGLGARLFDLAIFDSLMFDAGDEYKSHVLNNLDYHIGLAGYKICIYVGAKRGLLLDRLVKIVGQQSKL